MILPDFRKERLFGPRFNDYLYVMGVKKYGNFAGGLDLHNVSEENQLILSGEFSILRSVYFLTCRLMPPVEDSPARAQKVA